uniref:Uncharacterized protein n=1 Tax=Oryza punctata TaxID=4537 RepID=A0A0E0JGZ7_ORYPU
MEYIANGLKNINTRTVAAGGQRRVVGSWGPRYGAWRWFGVDVVRASSGAGGLGGIKGRRSPAFGGKGGGKVAGPRKWWLGGECACCTMHGGE